MVREGYTQKKNENKIYNNSYQVILEVLTDGKWEISPIWEPLPFRTYFAAKSYCDGLKFRLAKNEKYVVYDVATKINIYEVMAK